MAKILFENPVVYGKSGNAESYVAKTAKHKNIGGPKAEGSSTSDSAKNT